MILRKNIKNNVCESNSIGLYNENNLHAQIIEAESLPGDRFEVKVDGYIIDIVRKKRLIEIQTKNFSSIRKKLFMLVPNHRIKLVYPIAKEKFIVKIDPVSKKEVSRRKSPRKGKLVDIFLELIYIPELILHKNFEIELLFIKEEEIRCPDGQGSWRRKGESIVNRKLVEILNRVKLKNRKDFNMFLPQNLPIPFTNNVLAEYSEHSIYTARKLTYCLKKMGIIKECGKQGRNLLFNKAI